MKKPAYLSHYLVLKDLINGVDVRQYNDSIIYHTARIENIKCDLVKEGLHFDESAKVATKYSWYKPYRLIQTEENISRAKKLRDDFKARVDAAEA